MIQEESEGWRGTFFRFLWEPYCTVCLHKTLDLLNLSSHTLNNHTACISPNLHHLSLILWHPSSPFASLTSTVLKIECAVPDCTFHTEQCFRLYCSKKHTYIALIWVVFCMCVFHSAASSVDTVLVTTLAWKAWTILLPKGKKTSTHDESYIHACIQVSHSCTHQPLLFHNIYYQTSHFSSSNMTCLLLYLYISTRPESCNKTIVCCSN